MGKCPICKEKKDLISLSSPYICYGKNINFLICVDCKSVLDIQGSISDEIRDYGSII